MHNLPENIALRCIAEYLSANDINVWYSAGPIYSCRTALAIDGDCLVIGKNRIWEEYGVYWSHKQIYTTLRLIDNAELVIKSNQLYTTTSISDLSPFRVGRIELCDPSMFDWLLPEVYEHMSAIISVLFKELNDQGFRVVYHSPDMRDPSTKRWKKKSASILLFATLLGYENYLRKTLTPRDVFTQIMLVGDMLHIGDAELHHDNVSEFGRVVAIRMRHSNQTQLCISDPSCCDKLTDIVKDIVMRYKSLSNKHKRVTL